MNLCDVIDRVRANTAQVEIVGVENGDLMLLIRQGEFRNFVTNRGNGQVKRFREPKTVTNFLRTNGVRRYSLHLQHWDETQIFDRHKAATKLRAG